MSFLPENWQSYPVGHWWGDELRRRAGVLGEAAPEERAADLLETADILFNAGEYDQALLHYEAVYALVPSAENKAKVDLCKSKVPRKFNVMPGIMAVTLMTVSVAMLVTVAVRK